MTEPAGVELAIWERRARVLADLRAMREKQPSVYDGDLIDEARQEREDETDERGQLPGRVDDDQSHAD